MKNKHLLLIFCCTLLLGLVARYEPWFKSDIFQTDLVRVDTVDLQRISITQPGKSELLLERSDEGWVASQDDFAIKTVDSTITPLLQALVAIRSLRIVHTGHRDTLLLLPTQSIHVEVTGKKGAREVFEIGREIQENNRPATFIEIDRHDGIYLTNNYLRRIFTRTVDDFRSKTVLDFPFEKLRALRIIRPGPDTVYFQKSDTSSMWLSSKSGVLIPPEPVQKWVKGVLDLNGLPFATHAEEGHAGDNLMAVILLELAGAEEPLQLQIFDTGANIYFSGRPEKSPGRRTSSKLVVRSSQNAFNFFLLSDTLAAQKICLGPVTAPD